MTFRQSILLLICLSTIATLLACGGSSSTKLTKTTATLPDGNYVFSLAGEDKVATGIPLYYVAGVFTVAKGVIAGGEQDFVNFAQDYGTDQINPTGSSISKTSDGNLLITLTTCFTTNCGKVDNFVGVSGVETLNVSFLPLNSAKAFITEFDTSATASGELDLQTSAAVLSPPIGYAFALNGLDNAMSGNPLAIGGVIKIDGPGKISGAGSIFDANDNGSANTFQGQGFGPSSVSAPDSLGRLTFTLFPTDSTHFPKIALAGYIVDANHIRLVETQDFYHGTLGGTAFSQGANTGTFTSASVSGNSYVVGLTGFEAVKPFQVAGLFTFAATSSSTGSVTGVVSHNDLTGPPNQSPISGTYTVDGPGSLPDSGTGRVTVMITPGPPTISLQLYLDGNGHALAITMDPGETLGGLAFQQTGGGSFTSASFSGAYVMDATGWDKKVSVQSEFNAVGPVTAAGSAGTLTGTADLNWLLSSSPGPIFPDSPLSGTFTSAANGVFTGTLTGLDVTTCTVYTTTSPACTADVFTFYLIDSTGDSIAIETDANQLTLGFLNQK